MEVFHNNVIYIYFRYNECLKTKRADYNVASHKWTPKKIHHVFCWSRSLNLFGPPYVNYKNIDFNWLEKVNYSN